jgi:hypothetical protein
VRAGAEGGAGGAGAANAAGAAGGEHGTWVSYSSLSSGLRTMGSGVVLDRLARISASGSSPATAA